MTDITPAQFVQPYTTTPVDPAATIEAIDETHVFEGIAPFVTAIRQSLGPARIDVAAEIRLWGSMATNERAIITVRRPSVQGRRVAAVGHGYPFARGGGIALVPAPDVPLD